MAHRLKETLVIPIAVVFIAAVLWLARHSEPQVAEEPRPDFSTIENVKEKKETFFNYMLPKVRSANDRVLAQRAKLIMLSYELDGGRAPTADDASWLKQLATTYRINGDPLTNAESRNRLLKRVDAIPASLALAQAANESAWGTARFAVNGNNFFGLWCWIKNCGMVPTGRAPERRHEVASFNRVADGVQYYLLTLNSHPAYQQLRDIRWIARQNNVRATGMDLAAGLKRYSERGDAYVDEIRAMIRINNLQRVNR